MITSTRNPYIVAARKLNQRKYRQQTGLFAAEGLQLLHIALDSGWQPTQVFHCPALFTGPTAPALLQRCETIGATLLEVSENVMDSLSQRDTSQGLVAVFPQKQADFHTCRLPERSLVLVLDRLRDPGNIGTLLRTADAAGAAAVILLQPSADLYDPKTVRASMGSAFSVPVYTTDDLPALFGWLHRQQIRTIGADANRGQTWTAQGWSDSYALVLGNEAQGLSEALTQYIQHWVSLPLLGRAESLNVAVAGGILMYAWVGANN